MQEVVRRLNEAASEEVYRLPTGAEWEYACRAGTTTRWSFGDDESRLGEYAWYSDNAWNAGLQYAQPVGTKLPNPWGLYDMHGNVTEWCQDWLGSYTADSQINPTGAATGSRRVWRGGDFGRLLSTSRSATHFGLSPSGRDYNLGARLLRMEPVSPPSSGTGNDQQKITVTTSAGTTHEMVLVPAGEFIMGSNDGEDNEKPVHTVYLVTTNHFLDCFYLG